MAIRRPMDDAHAALDGVGNVHWSLESQRRPGGLQAEANSSDVGVLNLHGDILPRDVTHDIFDAVIKHCGVQSIIAEIRIARAANQVQLIDDRPSGETQRPQCRSRSFAVADHHDPPTVAFIFQNQIGELLGAKGPRGASENRTAEICERLRFVRRVFVNPCHGFIGPLLPIAEESFPAEDATLENVDGLIHRLGFIKTRS